MGEPTHGTGDSAEPEFDDPPPGLDADPPPDEDDEELDEPPSLPPPRGTADPTVSPFDGRDDWRSSAGRPRSCAQADPIVSDNAATVASPAANV